MTRLILKIFDLVRRCPRRSVAAFLVLTAVPVVLLLRLGYKEDIADFLPLDDRERTAMAAYQELSGADRIYAVFSLRDTSATDPDAIVTAVDAFAQAVEKADTGGVLKDVVTRMDMERVTAAVGFVYDHAPCFLTDADYARIDSLIATPGYADEALERDRQMLLFPSAGVVSDNISRDPLGLFSGAVERLRGQAASGMTFELYDGIVFSEDLTHAVVIITSPYGASETEHNAAIVDMLTACADSAAAVAPEVGVSLVGGPPIAVDNARQIKADSLLAVSLAAVVILLLLFLTLRSLRNLLLIAVGIGWGWLFAMGGLSLVHDDVSIIVIGISSVIIGIAVNYPLHYIAHLRHTPDRRRALREIVGPLVVGNVTTVGAFLALVPLRSVALRDLGLFASLLLVGTILFALLCLPHLAKVKPAKIIGAPTERLSLLQQSRRSLVGRRVVLGVVVALTAFFACFMNRTGFDADMTHINYLTPERRADLDYFSKMLVPTEGRTTLYVLATDTTLDAALDASLRLAPTLDSLQQAGTVATRSGCTPLLASKAEQQRRLARWHDFVKKNGEKIRADLAAAAARQGFSAEGFEDFEKTLSADYAPLTATDIAPLTDGIFAGNVTTAGAGEGTCSVADVISVDTDKADAVKEAIDARGGYAFDIASLNAAVTERLSADFNYIGFACGFIVFFFLWLSMGNIEMALLSFVPMAVSWVWILGIMGLLGIDFNIVNVILATFIFGQGDDYTIFMAEGAVYEYTYRRRMLASYKHSVILSALIMFVGIGTLIFARHPALRSLAEVTIAGMFSVVLMAYVFPPLIFGWLVRRGGIERLRPVTLSALLRRWWSEALGLTLRAAALTAFVFVRKTDKRRRLALCLCRQHLRLVPGLRAVAAGNEKAWKNPVPGVPVLLNFLERLSPEAALFALLRYDYAKVQMRDIARPPLTRLLLRRLFFEYEGETATVITIRIDGWAMLRPDDGPGLYKGRLTFVPETGDKGLEEPDYNDFEEAVRFVADRYRYRGADVSREVNRRLRAFAASSWRETFKAASSKDYQKFADGGWGECALLFALLHPECGVGFEDADEERRRVAEVAAAGLVLGFVVRNKWEDDGGEENDEGEK